MVLAEHAHLICSIPTSGSRVKLEPGSIIQAWRCIETCVAYVGADLWKILRGWYTMSAESVMIEAP